MAIEAGRDAEEILRPIAIRPDISNRSRRNFTGGLIERFQGQALSNPQPDQIRRACVHLDEFAGSLEQLDDGMPLEIMESMISVAANWSKALRDRDLDAATVFNEVRSTVAKLNQMRTNLVLDLPLNRQE